MAVKTMSTQSKQQHMVAHHRALGAANHREGARQNGARPNGGSLDAFGRDGPAALGQLYAARLGTARRGSPWCR